MLSLLIGLPFTGIGGALAFGRRRTIFDAGQGRVFRYWNLIVRVRSEERRLDDFTAVLIALQSDPDSADSYPVGLRARTGKDLKICFSTKFGESRERAEFLARFLNLNLEDRSTDHELVLSPEQAGETLQQRLRSGRAPTDRVARPTAMCSAVNESDAEANLVIPGRRWASLPFTLGAIIPLTITLFLIPVFARLFNRSDAPDPVQIVVLACLILVFGGLPLVGLIHAVLSANRSRTVIIASPAGILIEKRGVWRTRTAVIPADDILALDYSGVDSVRESVDRGSRMLAALRRWVSKGIIVKSRRGLFAFGEGLPGEELRYLLSVITRALASGERTI